MHHIVLVSVSHAFLTSSLWLFLTLSSISDRYQLPPFPNMKITVVIFAELLLIAAFEVDAWQNFPNTKCYAAGEKKVIKKIKRVANINDCQALCELPKNAPCYGVQFKDHKKVKKRACTMYRAQPWEQSKANSKFTCRVK